MAFCTQFASFFISPSGDMNSCRELNTFLKSHRIIQIEKQVITHGNTEGWSFLIEYGDEGAVSGNKTAPDKIDYREVLNEQDFALFDKLRQLRKTEAERTGVAVYAVFTNEQLAAMVQNPPKTLSDMLKIKNVGESRVKQFGSLFLKTIQEAIPFKTTDHFT